MIQWNVIAGLFLVTVAVVIITACVALSAEVLSDCIDRISIRTMAKKWLGRSVNKLNKRTPIMIHPLIRLDEISISSNLVISYHYTLPTCSVKNIDATSLFVRSMQPQVIKGACGKRSLRERFLEMLGLHITYIFIYSTAEGNHISTFEIDRAN